MESNMLKILEAEKMFDIGRAINLLWISFGDLVVIKNRKGIESERGHFAIHIQCPWRIIYQGELLLGDMDIYTPQADVNESDFDWSEIGYSIFDEKLIKIKAELLPIKVISTYLDNTGYIKILFEKDVVFEAMPNGSSKTEFWRFIDFMSNNQIVIFE